MARGEIKIPMALDTSGIEKSIKNGLIDPVEEAEDALKKLGKVDAGADLEKSIDHAQRSTEDLDDQLDKTRESLKRLGYAGKDAGDDGKRGMDRIKAGAQEVQTEFGQNMSETVSSFRGELSDIGQLGQDTLGGLAGTLSGFGALGAAGAAGLGLVAAGVGVITEAWEKTAEATEEARDAAFEFAYDVSGALDAAGYSTRLSSWTSDTEKFKQATDLATASGMDVADVIDALASGGPKLDKLSQAFQDNALNSMVTGGRVMELEGVLKGTADGFLSGADAAKLNAAVLGEYADRVGVASGETDTLGNAIVNLPDGKQVVVDAETGQAFEDLNAVERKKLSNKSLDVGANTGAAMGALGSVDQKRLGNKFVDVEVRRGNFDAVMSDIANRRYRATVTLGVNAGRLGAAVPV